MQVNYVSLTTLYLLKIKPIIIIKPCESCCNQQYSHFYTFLSTNLSHCHTD